MDRDQASFMSYLPPSANSTLELRPRNLGEQFNDESFAVFLRLKPAINSDLYVIQNENTLIICPPSGQKQNGIQKRKYTFSSILRDSASQEDTFSTCVLPLLQSFWRGRDCTIMAYGTTSAGKSFTMHGAKEQPGIIPRVIISIFSKLSANIEPSRFMPISNFTLRYLTDNEILDHNRHKKRLLDAVVQQSKACRSDSFGVCSYYQMENIISDVEEMSGVVSIWASMIEIYNEQVIDLLVLDDDKKKDVNLRVNEDENGCFYAKNAQQINVNNGSEAFQIYLFGRDNLHKGSTALNVKSSRSHCILFLTIITHASEPSEMRVNRFSFADLAGSERSKKTLNTGTRLQESKSINQSLTTLGKCMRIMKNNQGSRNPLHIPFRDSKLTKLFKNALTGSEQMAFIVNVSPDPILYGETLNVLGFSALAQEVVPLQKEKKTRFSTIMESGRFQAPGFAWAASHSDLRSDTLMDLTNIQSQLTTALSRIEALEVENVALEDRLFVAEDALEAARKDKADAIAKYKKERKTADELRANCGTLFSDIQSSKDAIIASKNAEIQKLKEDCSELEEELDILEDKKESYKNKLKSIVPERNRLKDEMTRITEENTKLKSKIKNLERLLDDAAAEYQNLKQEKLLEAETYEKLEEDLRSEIEFLKTEMLLLEENKRKPEIHAETNTLNTSLRIMVPKNWNNVGTSMTPRTRLESDEDDEDSHLIPLNLSTMTPQTLSECDGESKDFHPTPLNVRTATPMPQLGCDGEGKDFHPTPLNVRTATPMPQLGCDGEGKDFHLTPLNVSTMTPMPQLECDEEDKDSHLTPLNVSTMMPIPQLECDGEGKDSHLTPLNVCTTVTPQAMVGKGSDLISFKSVEPFIIDGDEEICQLSPYDFGTPTDDDNDLRRINSQKLSSPVDVRCNALSSSFSNLKIPCDEEILVCNDALSEMMGSQIIETEQYIDSNCSENAVTENIIAKQREEILVCNDALSEMMGSQIIETEQYIHSNCSENAVTENIIAKLRESNTACDNDIGVAPDNSVSDKAIPKQRASNTSCDDVVAPDNTVSDKAIPKQRASNTSCDDVVAPDNTVSDKAIPKQRASNTSCDDVVAPDNTFSDNAISKQQAFITLCDSAATENTIPKQRAFNTPYVEVFGPDNALIECLIPKHRPSNIPSDTCTDRPNSVPNDELLVVFETEMVDKNILAPVENLAINRDVENIVDASGVKSKVCSEESGYAKSTKKPKTGKKTRDPFDHPALSCSKRGKKSAKENESVEDTSNRKAKKQLFSATEDFLDFSDSDDSHPFVSPVKRNLRPRTRKTYK